MRFQEKTVVVTGASRGIGREIALAFAREGAKVACVATTEAGAQATVDAIGGVAKAYACDVSDSASVEALFEAVTKDLGTPAVLVNNAGITRDTLLVRMKDEDWDRVMSVNLKGAFLCIRAVTRPMMKARYGRIVNISSVVGQTGATGQANYAAAKAGLSGLTKSVAKELGSRGITCNSVAPGFIETDMTDGLSADFREQVVNTAPAGRLGTPADIAHAVIFLASDEAGYITGQTLTVDGGLTL
ncbi:3-oxoacyl-[acyl-carrier-protein] reductase [Fimbriimonas ginsengisoli]|uniref:3-oxoacyl-[acyl-carrier-protein] reductase n=1 Tax=Fimbriimonas ginsengisoli Gsoil 348 TaxID=661478 RepID=A0A068NMP3_FIMGI|nr:3-oxoacyl-[acyl-carrier-protein] reductase [Fimbriimonas ginsengisoli]AIE84838.1 beta-ketoacyl-acyl carrier protein reductase [Fimbriimonas ginsengisoli Gsoil 348]